MRAVFALAAIALPVAFLGVLLARPTIDESWENNPAHFWLVLTAAAAAVALGYAVSQAARRRRDARLFLISLALIASAGFFGLHALATPGVLLGKNAGFELAVPVGLVVAGVFAACSGIELRPASARWVVRGGNGLLGMLVALMCAWAVVSLAGLPPLDDPLATEELDGWQLVLALLGVTLYALAALGYMRLYRRRRARFVFAFMLAFVLLAEAMVVIAWARNWRVSWWEWHVLMLMAFVVIALAARSEWHEERFSDLYLEATFAGAKEVSVILADLAGFTSFSERHATTDVAAMLNAYFEQLVPLMERAGGEVHQIAGDELMVIFNKEGEVPDHAARAASAALVLQRAAESIARDHPTWPRFRVGVNSGEVLAGVLGGARGHRKHGVVGDMVNVAARLQAEAPVGSVVIGEGTFGALPGEAVVEAMPARRVKGKAEPIDGYLLISVPNERTT